MRNPHIEDGTNGGYNIQERKGVGVCTAYIKRITQGLGRCYAKDKERALGLESRQYWIHQIEKEGMRF